METIILQVPIPRILRDKAKKTAQNQGFSSLQEAVRVFLNHFSKKDVEFGFHSAVELSPQNEARYTHMVHEVQSGKVKTRSFSDPQMLMKHLEK